MSTKLPSFQFYVGDWRKDTDLQGCSIGARGLWFEMLCMMHEASKRGYLQHENGKPVAVKKIARIAGCTVCETTRFINELEESGVFSRTSDDVIYSRRMVRDEERREQLRKNGEAGAAHGAKGGGFGKEGGRPSKTPQGTPQETPLVTGQETPRKPPSSSSSSSSVSSSTSEVIPLPHPAGDGEQPANPPKAKTAKEPKPKIPRRPNPLFDAIVEVTGASPTANGPMIGKVAAVLAREDPPYTPEEVHRFAVEFWKHCPWAAEDGRTRPFVNELEKYIYLIRAKPKEPTAHAGVNNRSVGGHRVEAEPGLYSNLPNSITVGADTSSLPSTAALPEGVGRSHREHQADSPAAGLW